MRSADRPGRTRVVRTLAWLATALCLTLLATGGGALLAYQYYGGRISTVSGLEALQDPTPSHVSGVAAPPQRAENFLIVGSDTADSLSDEQLAEIGLGRTDRNGVRTDTVLLMHLPSDGSGARFVSFPRDSLVNIPGHSPNKINSAYGFGEQQTKGGGPALLVRTVEDLSGLKIDHYVEVNLYGLATITNSIGGVQVCLSKDAVDPLSGMNLKAGRHMLDGRQAMSFVRQRHNLEGGDLGRIRRQQYFIGAAVRQILSAGVLLNPVKVNSLLRSATDSIRTDPGTSTDDLLAVALRLRNVSAGKIDFQTVPVLNPDARRNLPGQRSASVVLLDDAALPTLFAALEGRTVPSPTPTHVSPTLTVPPHQIVVQVENGSGVPGLAQVVVDQLDGAGFRANRVSSTSLRTSRTTVRYGAARADSGLTVAAAFPGAITLSDPELNANQIVVTVGSDFTTVRTVTVAPPASSTAPTPAAAPPVTAADDGCIA